MIARLFDSTVIVIRDYNKLITGRAAWGVKFGRSLKSKVKSQKSEGGGGCLRFKVFC